MPKSDEVLAPDIELPKKPLITDDDQVQEVIKHPEEFEIEPLLRDVEVELKVGDLQTAKDLYHKMLHVYNGLTREEKQKYYGQVYSYYERLRPKRSFFARLFGKN